MKATLTLLAALAFAPMTAQADDDDCFVPMTDWQPRDVVAEHARQNGWTARRIKVDDGCYEIEGFDTDGREIEVKLHPQSLEIVEFEYEDDDDDDHRDRRHDRNDDDD
ncbi:MAG: PepSY domain-containing protein [Pseudomonadota bacterium]|nr:PepSY domain-containing protein [Pseudomonadota bacterium]